MTLINACSDSITTVCKIRSLSRWIIVSPFPPRYLNRDASLFHLCLYALWPRQFQSDNFSSPAKTVRYASLCIYLGVWIYNRVSSSSALSEARLRYDVARWVSEPHMSAKFHGLVLFDL